MLIAPSTRLAALLGLLLVSTAAAQSPYTKRLDVGPTGLAAEGSSISPVLSSNGEFVVFSSTADNLLAPASSGPEAWNLFVSELRTGALEQVNLGSAAQPLGLRPPAGDGGGFSMQFTVVEQVAISGDGRFVAFSSSQDDPGLPDQNGADDVYLRDRWTGTTEVISVGLDGTTQAANSFEPSISDDGRLVVFGAGGNLVVPGPPLELATRRIYLRDRQAGVTSTVSHLAPGFEGGTATGAQLSADGRKVVYRQSSGILVGQVDPTLMLFDVASGTTDVFPGLDPQLVLSIDRTGSRIAFMTSSSLVPSDQDGRADVYVLEVATGELSIASDATDGSSLPGDAVRPSLSPDGRYVAFEAGGSGLAWLAGLEGTHVYVHDLETGLTTLASINDQAHEGSGPGQANAGIRSPRALSEKGARLVYQSSYKNLAAPAGVAETVGIFLQERQTDGPDLKLTNLVAGDKATLTVTDAAPGGGVLVALSTTGQGPIPSYWGLVDLTPPLVSFTVSVDATGVATAQLPVDPGMAGTAVFLKGIDILGYVPTTSFTGVVE